MNDSYLDIDKLKDYLKERTGLGYLNGGHTELICRCPFPDCEHEVGKNKKNGRLYIDTRSPVFYCFICGATGTILKLFKVLGIPAKEFVNLEHDVFKQTGRCRNIDTSSTAIVDISKSIRIQKLKDPKSFIHKQNYLRGRLGYEIEVSNLPNVVFDIKQFIQSNGLQISEKDKSMLDIYDNQYVGFLSNRGTVLTLRKTFGEGDDYHRLIFTQAGKFKDFYGVWSGSVDREQINKIVICEGVFDLLVGIKSSELKSLLDGSVYWAAALGSHYRGLITSVLDQIKLSYVDVVVLSDKDKKPSDKIFRKLAGSPMVRNLEIYWNKLGNDFGAYPIEPIKTIYKPPVYNSYNKNTRQSSFR